MNFIINTPEGTRDRLFAECTDRRKVQNTLTDLFSGRGYAEISTPEVEFYDPVCPVRQPLAPGELSKNRRSLRQDHGHAS